MANTVHNLCVVVLLVALSEATIFQDCGSVTGKIVKVDVAGCPGSTNPCPLKKNTNVTFDVTFQPSEDVTKATSVVHGILAGIPVPFPIDKPDVCSDTSDNITCPMTSGATYTYHTQLAVLSSYPSLNVIVKWEMKDVNSKDIFCLQIPVSIVNNVENSTKHRSSNSINSIRQRNRPASRRFQHL